MCISLKEKKTLKIVHLFFNKPTDYQESFVSTILANFIYASFIKTKIF